MASKPILLRPAGDDDTNFLFRVFTESHGAELDLSGLPDAQREQLLRLQFRARQDQYHSQYPTADNDVIMIGSEAAGYFCAIRGPDSFVLVDIALLREFRGAEIGSRLVGELIELARMVNKPLRAHVLKNSPAWRLWQRLGFREVSDDGVYLEIEA